MRKTDLHPLLQATAVPVPGRGGVYAVMPQPVPERVEVPECYPLFALARRELDALVSALERYPHSDLLLRTLNRREAVDSSQIEGTRTGFDDLLLYEMDLADNAPDINPDARETLAYVRAFTQGAAIVAAQGKAALNGKFIQQIHRVLMSGKATYTPGRFRDRQNYIGMTLETARYVPPPAEAIPQLMHDLETLLQYEPDGMMTTSILMRAAIVHVQFEAIHPFLDGNGRTGRLLLPFMFQADGEPPIHLATFLKARQQAYYDALLAVQTRLNWTPWIRLFLECVIASCMHTIRLMEGLEKMQVRWEELLREHKKRRHATIWKVVGLLIGQPVITVNEVVRQLGVSFPSANTAVEELVALDVLRTSSPQRRNRVFQAHEVLNALHTGLDDVLREAADRGRL